MPGGAHVSSKTDSRSNVVLRMVSEGCDEVVRMHTVAPRSMACTVSSDPKVVRLARCPVLSMSLRELTGARLRTRTGQDPD
jgi:hypothetical protein